jgi:hypothetical protein
VAGNALVLIFIPAFACFQKVSPPQMMLRTAARSHSSPASLFTRLHLPILVARTARDLEDTVVLLLSSPIRRARLSRAIAQAVASASDTFGESTGGGAAVESVTSLNVALRLAHEAAALRYQRVAVAECDDQMCK